jgi:predicted kinase
MRIHWSDAHRYRRRVIVPAGALVVLIGASGSGKSTFAARHFEQDSVISSDQLRELISGDEADQRVNDTVFQRIHEWVDRRLQSGALAVVDATNTDWMWRATLIRQARRHQRPAIAIVFDLDAEICRQRNQSRSRRVRASIISDQVEAIARDRERLELEGFAGVRILSSPPEVDQAGVEIASRPARGPHRP